MTRYLRYVASVTITSYLAISSVGCSSVNSKSKDSTSGSSKESPSGQTSTEPASANASAQLPHGVNVVSAPQATPGPTPAPSRGSANTPSISTTGGSGTLATTPPTHIPTCPDSQPQMQCMAFSIHPIPPPNGPDGQPMVWPDCSAQLPPRAYGTFGYVAVNNQCLCMMPGATVPTPYKQTYYLAPDGKPWQLCQ
jgi:hypothetical protein